MSDGKSKAGDDGHKDIDWQHVFPTARIKKEVKRDKGVGKLSNKAVEYIGACSALFVQNLVTKAETNGRVTLESVREASQTHDFLKGALDGVTEETAPRPKKKRKKTDLSVKQAKEAIASVSSSSQTDNHRPEITVDEDDYD